MCLAPSTVGIGGNLTKYCRIRPRSIVCDSGLKEELLPSVNARNQNKVSLNAENNTSHSESRHTISQDTTVRLDRGNQIRFSPNEGRAPESTDLERDDSRSPAKSNSLSSPHSFTQCDVCHRCGYRGDTTWLDVTRSAERGCLKCALMKEIILICAGNIEDPEYSSILWFGGVWAPSLCFTFDRAAGYTGVEVFVPPGGYFAQLIGPFIFTMRLMAEWTYR